VIDLLIPVLFYRIRRRRWLKLHPESRDARPATVRAGDGELATA
jgi:hypothetical protein